MTLSPSGCRADDVPVRPSPHSSLFHCVLPYPALAALLDMTGMAQACPLLAVSFSSPPPPPPTFPLI